MPITARPDAATRSQLHTRLAGSRIPGLDGLRALAVALVVFFHFGFDWVNGATGVLMFFVLSGFLITWLLLHEHAKTRTIGLRAFYTRRFFRLYPPLAVYWIIVLAAAMRHGEPIDWGIRFAALGYYTNYYLPFHLGADSNLGHTWSLGVEEQFYLLWPLIVMALGANLRRLSTAVIVLIGAIWVWRIGLYVAGVSHSYLYHSFETRFDEMLVGCLLAITIKRGVHVERLEALAARQWYPAVTLALLAFSSMVLQAADPSDAYRYMVGWAIESMLAAALIVQLVLLSDSGIWRVFDSAPAQFIGRISYSIYLYQQLVLFTGRRLAAAWPVPVQLACAVGGTLAFAVVSYYVVERPFRRRRQITRLAPATEPSPALSLLTTP